MQGRDAMRMNRDAARHGAIKNLRTQNTKNMAIIVPHRPRYRDRSLPIYYLSNGQMVLRQRPREVHDPRTQAQLYQRLRMRVASHFLSSFKSIISLGFAPEEQDNFRMVGGYQLALGQLMREGLVKEPGGVRIRTERVQLSSGRTNPMQSLKARVLPGKLHLTWSGELPKRCAMLLVGVWNRDKAKALSLNIEDPISSHELYISIPDDWEHDTLDVWAAPWNPGVRGRFDSLHTEALPIALPPVSPGIGEGLVGKITDLTHLPTTHTDKYTPERKRRRIRVIDIFSGRRRRE